jgi:hypothetical protein
MRSERRARADDGYPLRTELCRRVGLGDGFVLAFPVHGEALEGTDGNRLVDLGTAAGLLTCRVTDPTADERQWVTAPYEPGGIGEAALGDECDMAAAFW